MHFIKSLFLILLPLGLLVCADEQIIMEPGNPGVELVGAWTTANTAPEHYGADYVVAANTPNGVNRVVFRPTIRKRGTYELSVWMNPNGPLGSDRTAVELRVNIEKELLSVSPELTELIYSNTLDHRGSDSGWHHFTTSYTGTFELPEGHAVSISLVATGTQGVTLVDAIRLEWGGDAHFDPTTGGNLTIDDDDILDARFEGTWSSGNSIPGFTGKGYRVANPGSPSPTRAIYTPYITTAGIYEVRLRVPGKASNNPAVPVTVQHRDGSATVTIDQRTGGRQVLGRWPFDAGVQGSVIIDATQASSAVIADAVEFHLLYVPQSAQPVPIPATIPGKNFLNEGTLAFIASKHPDWAWVGPQRQEAPFLPIEATYLIEATAAGTYDIAIDLEGQAGPLGLLEVIDVSIDGILVGSRHEGPSGGIHRQEKLHLEPGVHAITIHPVIGLSLPGNPVLPWAVYIKSVTVTPSPTVQTPFGGSPQAVPGLIQAEAYDTGGIGLAYNRVSWEITTGEARPDDIGIKSKQNAFGEVHFDNVLRNPRLAQTWGSTPIPVDSSWCEYTIDCAETRQYAIVLNAQALGGPATANQLVQLSIDGMAASDPVAVTVAGGWQLTTIPRVTIPVGVHRLRFTLLPPPGGPYVSGDTNSTPYGLDLDWIQISKTAEETLIVMENDDPGVTLQGRWYPSTIAPGYHGPDYLYAIGMPHRDERAIYRPTVLTTGEYEISVWYPSRNVRSAAVPITVTTYNKSEQKVIDQRSHGGEWVTLGTWILLAGHSTSVTIETGRQSGITVADAVRFRKLRDFLVYPAVAGDVVIDDSDAQRVHFTGTWFASHVVKDFLGTGYHYANPASATPTTAIYTPYLPMAGMYEVTIGFPAYGGRSPSTPITIRHRDGSTRLILDQRHDGEQVLGRWLFSAGDQGSLTIDGASGLGYVIADWVRFRPISSPKNGRALPVPGRFDGAEFDLSSYDVRISDTDEHAVISHTEAFYTIQVATSSAYDVSVPYYKDPESTFNSTINQMAVAVDGVRVAERLYAPNRQVLRAEKIHLSAGIHSLSIITQEADGPYLNSVGTVLEFIDVSPSPSVQTAFSGTPAHIPGTIHAEDYDLGGLGLAYNHISWSSSYPRYRLDDIGISYHIASPDLAVLLDTATVNPTVFLPYEPPDPVIGLPPQSYEPTWVEYTIEAADAGNYDVVLKALWNNHSVQIAIDGVPAADPITVAGDGSTLSDAVVPDIAIPAGVHRVRITLLPPLSPTAPSSLALDSLQIMAAAPTPLNKG